MTQDEITFGLRKITSGQFATIESVDIKDDSIKLNFGFTFGINEDYRIVNCTAKFEYFSEELPFMKIDVSCDFEVAETSWKYLINNNSNKIILPLFLVTHLAVLTVGTARGVLHCKTENTKYNKYFLPTINVTDSIKSDITIDLIKAE